MVQLGKGKWERRNNSSAGKILSTFENAEKPIQVQKRTTCLVSVCVGSQQHVF